MRHLFYLFFIGHGTDRESKSPPDGRASGTVRCVSICFSSQIRVRNGQFLTGFGHFLTAFGHFLTVCGLIVTQIRRSVDGGRTWEASIGGKPTSEYLKGHFLMEVSRPWMEIYTNISRSPSTFRRFYESSFCAHLRFVVSNYKCFDPFKHICLILSLPEFCSELQKPISRVSPPLVNPSKTPESHLSLLSNSFQCTQNHPSDV